MAKLYFKYGAMGSSKTAQVLITKFNYEERGMRVFLIKPEIDTRDGAEIIRSRIGLSATAVCVPKDASPEALLKKEKEKYDVIIADECQFFTKEQIDSLRDIVDRYNIPVLCFGLRTDFLTRLFPGSARLFEVADSIAEIKTICACGAKATVNARLNDKGRILTHGSQVMLGGNDRYLAMCHKCWTHQIEKQKENQ